VVAVTQGDRRLGGRGRWRQIYDLGTHVSHHTDAPEHLPPAPGASRPHALFEGLAADGDLVTFVCYDDGYGIRRGGDEVAGWRWDAGRLDDAMAAFRGLANPAVVRLVPPPPAD
jgi:hypothetical protein